MEETSQNLHHLMFLILGMINMLTYEIKYTTGNDLLYKFIYIYIFFFILIKKKKKELKYRFKSSGA